MLAPAFLAPLALPFPLAPLAASALVNTSSGIGAVVLIASSLVAVIGTLAFIYAVFRTKGMQESNKILRDLTEDLTHALGFRDKELQDEINRRTETEQKYAALLSAVHDLRKDPFPDGFDSHS